MMERQRGRHQERKDATPPKQQYELCLQQGMVEGSKTLKRINDELLFAASTHTLEADLLTDSIE
jgi:hypothetical protein